MKITKLTLNNLRNNQQKSHYGSHAKAMFVNGVFDSDNWNGGDGLIRQYFYDKVRHETLAKNISFTDDLTHFYGDIIVTHSCNEDQSYVTIVFAGHVEDTLTEEEEVYEHVAYFSWYKNRGRTEAAKFDGKPMLEHQYLFILNALQETGFEFDVR